MAAVAKLSQAEWVNFWTYYKGLPHQVEAVKELYVALEATADSHVQDTAPWIRTYRTAPEEPDVISVINQAGIDLIKQWEGLRLDAYICPAGVWTIGYGSTGDHVYPGLTIGEPEAERLLRLDLQRFEDSVSKSVKVHLTDNEYAALCSFAFNVGCGAFESSTLLRRLNAGENKGRVFTEELPRWSKANGQTLQGLLNRRNAEVELALS